jgi:hypothetical protein
VRSALHHAELVRRMGIYVKANAPPGENTSGWNY